jgi:hypothetical protein
MLRSLVHVCSTILTPAVISLLLLAAVSRMPETLPSPLCKVEFLVWLWDWTRDTLHAFINMRHPQ